MSRSANLAQAIPEYIRAADLLPESDEAQLKAGQLLLLGRQFEDAQTRAGKILQRNPAHVDAQLLRAAALARMNKVDEAVEQIEAAVRADPTRSDLHSDMGMLEAGRGNLEEAEAAFKRAVETDPKSISARIALGNFYWMSRRLDEAEAVLKQAGTIDPESYQWNRAMAAFYIGARRRAEAEPHLKTIAEVRNDDVSRLTLAEYYMSMNREPEARTILETLRGGSGDAAAQAHVRLATIALKENKRSDAYRLIDEALKKRTNYPMALVVKAEMLLQDNKTDEALAAARAAASADPKLADRAHDARSDSPDAA